MISLHGSKAKYQHEMLGVNSRLDSLQAAILNAKLKHLEDWTQARIRIAEKYMRRCKGWTSFSPTAHRT
jgi:dTDP-4-amino-4,6-dideoxygalactose transaminase